ncbi:heterokaryon incompatibility protein-domain-containing protein [Lasiosphaeria ovina]|uniref:Heterokaryon incompatibility protein-domain-containing protein n=1 Tax=Lasiosphaeria ovina TaxID=92902 RepID=A0AAE0NFG1_9PEZI|nr:heterokaryon incompatibility protein-domain-containing protein [Lasiosphaeria ovina]
MRLVDTKNLKLEEFVGDNVPKYAILSHTWDSEELSFSDTSNLDEAMRKSGFAKFESSCAKVYKLGLEWLWIDTCCIDRSSSAELSEAINSMHRWYQASEVCLA